MDVVHLIHVGSIQGKGHVPHGLTRLAQCGKLPVYSHPASVAFPSELGQMQHSSSSQCEHCLLHATQQVFTVKLTDAHRTCNRHNCAHRAYGLQDKLLLHIILHVHAACTQSMERCFRAMFQWPHHESLPPFLISSARNQQLHSHKP